MWDVVPATEGSWMTAHPTVDRIQKDGIAFTNLEMAVTAPAMTVSDREREVGLRRGRMPEGIPRRPLPPERRPLRRNARFSPT